jgi:dinuclear metal center YbgI/SA1388 family protein
MVTRPELVAYTNNVLSVDEFQDYCPNGLQVEGSLEVRKLASGVTASLALIEAATATGADALLVHHGYFWKGEDPRVTGMKQKRIALLLENDISLLAYHLPLDAHPKYGNNVQLARVLELEIEGRFGAEGGPELALFGRLQKPVSGAEFASCLARQLGRVPLHVLGGSEPVATVGWCTGAAQSYIYAASALGLDAFISGEVSEPTVHVAREAQIHYFAAGHHATERYGVQALGSHLAEHFQLEYEFIDIDNPV